MPVNRRWTMSGWRSAATGVLVIVALFVLFAGVGLLSWFLIAFALALLVGAFALYVVSTANSRITSWAPGMAKVIHASGLPSGASKFGRCVLQLVVRAPGVPETGIRHRDSNVPVAKWPTAGATLPVLVAVRDPRRIRVMWDDVRPHLDDAAPGREAFTADDTFADDDIRADGGVLADRAILAGTGSVIDDDTFAGAGSIVDETPAGGGPGPFPDAADEPTIAYRRARATVADRPPPETAPGTPATETATGPTGDAADEPTAGPSGDAADEPTAGPSGDPARAAQVAPSPRPAPSPGGRRPRPYPRRSDREPGSGAEPGGRPASRPPAPGQPTSPAMPVQRGPEHRTTEVPPIPRPAPDDATSRASEAPTRQVELLLRVPRPVRIERMLPVHQPLPALADPAPVPGRIAGRPDEAAARAYASAVPAPARRPVTRIRPAVTLFVSDPVRSAEFYRGILGLAEINRGPGSAILDCGGGRLVLRKAAQVSEIDRNRIHLLLEVADVGEIYEDLRARGLPFFHRPRMVASEGDHDLWSASFRDPDGYGVALAQWRPRPRPGRPRPRPGD